MKKCNVIDWIAIILVIIGALNWGCVGIFDLNIVHLIFAKIAIVEKIIYIVVGLAGLWNIYTVSKCCKNHCGGE